MKVGTKRLSEGKAAGAI